MHPATASAIGTADDDCEAGAGLDMQLVPVYSIGIPAWVLRESSEVKPLANDGIATSAIVSTVQPPFRCTIRTGRIWP